MFNVSAPQDRQRPAEDGQAHGRHGRHTNSRTRRGNREHSDSLPSPPFVLLPRAMSFASVVAAASRPAAVGQQRKGNATQAKTPAVRRNGAGFVTTLSGSQRTRPTAAVPASSPAASDFRSLCHTVLVPWNAATESRRGHQTATVGHSWRTRRVPSTIPRWSRCHRASDRFARPSAAAATAGACFDHAALPGRALGARSLTNPSSAAGLFASTAAVRLPGGGYSASPVPV
jgi:hypothetical protein